MSVGGTGGQNISAAIQLDLAQLQAQVNQAVALTDKLGQNLKGIPSPQVRLPTDQLKGDSSEIDSALRVILSQLHLIPGAGALAQSALLGVGRDGISMGAALGGGAAAGLVALTGAMVAASKAAIELEHNIAAVKSIKLDLDTKDATESIRALSTAVGQSSASLSKSLYDIFSSIEVSQGDAIKLLAQFSQGAVAAQTDAKTFGTSLIGVLNAYKLSVDDAAHVSDVFFNTVKAGVVTGEELAHGLGPVTQSAKQAGVSIDELGALIAGVTKEGGDAAENFTRLNNLLSHLVTKETAQGFAALGISVEDATGKLRSPLAIMAELKTRLEGMTAAAKANVLQEIFPEIRARQGAQVILSQLDFINEQLAINQTKTGSTAEAYKTMAQTSQAAIDRLKQGVIGLAGEVGDTLTPAIAKSAEGWAIGLEAFRKYVADVKRLAADAGIGFEKPAENTPGTAQSAATAAGTAVGTAVGVAPLLATTSADQARQEVEKAAALATQILGQFGGLGEKAPAEFVAAFTKGLASQQPELAKAFNDLVANSASSLAGAWATATDETTDAEDALLAKMDAELRQALPGMGERFYTTIREQVIAKAKAAFDGAGDVTETFVAKLRAGLADTAEIAQAVGQKKINLDTILANTQSSEAAIASIFEYQKQLKDVDAALKNLSDRGLAAHIQALLNQIASTNDAAEADRLWTEVVATSRGQMAAQTATQEAATVAQRQAEAATKALADAQAKAANEGASVYQKRLFELADAALPGLTAAETAQLKAMEDLNDQTGLLALITAKLGLSQADAQALLAGTNAEFDAYKKQVADATKTTTEHGAAVKSLGDLYTDELKGRASSAIGSLAGATDAASAAWAKYQVEQGKSREALQGLLQAAGAAPAAIQSITTALEAGGAAAFEAGEKIKALTTYARDASGTVRLKVEIDVEQTTHQIADLQKSYQEQSQKLAAEEIRATADHMQQVQSLSETFQAASAKYGSDLNTIETARTKAAADLTDQIGKASDTANAALAKLHQSQDDTLDKYNAAVDAANVTYGEAALAAGKTLLDAQKAQADQAEKGLRQVTDAQINAFRQVASAMGSFNIAQLQRDAQASISLQTSQNQQNSFTDVQSLQSAQRLAQVQAQGQAGLSQVAADFALNQTKNAAANSANDAERAYQRQLADAEAQAEKTRQTFFDATNKATEAYAKSMTKLDDDLARQLRDFQLQEIAINKSLDKALSQAQTQHKEAMKKLDDQVEAAQKAFNQAAQHHVEQLTQEDRQFQTQEQARATERALLDKHFLEQDLTLGRQLAVQRDLITATHDLPQKTASAIAQVLQLGPQQITQHIQQVAETGVDFADTLGASLLRRVRSNV